MAMHHHVRHLRLVTVDGTQIARVPRRPRGWNVRRDRETRIAIIREHMGYISQSLGRLNTLVSEIEASCGIAALDYTPWPRPDALNPNPPTPPELIS